ncbi:lipoprotein-releasing system ATP-binding protein LolD 1 [Haloferula helveola]|uniref:Lipoprotein-releasing system ATP-binding protein LolD 1 n=1 Tax=Haloferula helveola TaxID=490095 RepID=A0ABN6H354_9BACT|nr:lipoprotein-releasing system ATP-binding protein LolD 1 [Haloferula helveola]
MAMMIQIEDVWRSYDEGRIEVLKGVGLEVRDGETLALVGSSGCGKSTLLNVVAGLEVPQRGKVKVAGQTVNDEASRRELLRHQLGFVFQLHHLITGLTLEENLLVPAVAVGLSRKEARGRVRELAAATGLERRLDRRVRELSGGERQRGALCRALMNRPRLLLADEPTGALDERNREAVFELLMGLVADRGLTLMMATHDPQLAGRCQRMVRMRDGRVEP